MGPAGLLHTYLKPSVLNSDAPRLADEPHDLNLITIRHDREPPTDFARLNAVWPGPVLEFKPDYKGEPLADIQSIKRISTGFAIGKSPSRSRNGCARTPSVEPFRSYVFSQRVRLHRLP